MEATNCSDSYGDKKFVNLAVTTAAFSSVSILACLFALFVIILFRKWRSFGQRLFIYLIISATLFSVATALRRGDFDQHYTPADRRYCEFSGFLTQITLWFMIDSIVAITLYLLLAARWRKLTEGYEWLYITFIFGFPFTFSWIPFINHTFGRVVEWCWIKLVDPTTCNRTVFGQVLQMLMFYLPLVIILPSLVMAYLVMWVSLRKQPPPQKGVISDTSRAKKVMTSETLYLLIYPLVFFVFSLPTLIARIPIWVHPENTILGLLYIAVIFEGLLGAAITLAFLLEKDTRSRLKWSHIRAAFMNYRATEGVSEYAAEDAGGEGEVTAGRKVPYNRMKSNYSRSSIFSFLEKSIGTLTRNQNNTLRREAHMHPATPAHPDIFHA